MDNKTFRYWTCPGCAHVRALNLEQMTNNCQIIDQGKSRVDGETWEHHDHDICPAFEPASQPASVLISDDHPINSFQ